MVLTGLCKTRLSISSMHFQKEYNFKFLYELYEPKSFYVEK
jgi:hypothetical protein